LGIFKRLGLENLFDEYDVPLRGVGQKHGGYAYETHHDTETTHDWSDTDPDVVINEAYADIEEYQPDSESMSANDEIKRRLRDLGYA